MVWLLKKTKGIEMKLQAFYDRLVWLADHATLGMDDMMLTDFEFGPSCTNLSQIKASDDGVELVFKNGKTDMRIQEALEILKPLLETIPTAMVVRMYKGVYVPITKVYEDVPVFIIECYDPYPSR